MATKTANGLYEYNLVVRGKTLDDWVQDINQYICELNDWRFFVLPKGSYEYDNLALAVMLAHVMLLPGHTSEDALAEILHKVWVSNYTFWRDNKPQHPYIKPTYRLGDERREMRVKTNYNDLPSKEKEQSLILARFFLEEFGLFF